MTASSLIRSGSVRRWAGGPDTTNIHVVYARVDIPTSLAHVGEADWLDLDRFGPAAGDSVLPDQQKLLSFEFPGLVTVLVFDHSGGPVLQCAGRRPTNKWAGSTR